MRVEIQIQKNGYANLENHENQAPLGRDLHYWTWGTLLTIDEAFRDPRSPGFC
jgi:hypothetical protein